MKKLVVISTLAMLTGIAQATVLTFEIDGMSSYTPVPQAYGDYVSSATNGAFVYGEMGEGFTPAITVDYIGVAGGDDDGLFFWGANYGDLNAVVENEDDGERWTTLRFTADEGEMVVLHSMDMGIYGGSPILIDSITVSNESGTVLFQENNYMLDSGTGHTNLNFGSVTGQVLTLVLDLQTAAATDENDSVGLDNITFSQPGTVEPPLDAVLTVESAHGSPDPAVGINEIPYGTTGTCTVEQVTFGLTNYSPIGWTMTGNEPLSGSTNWFVGTLTNDAVLTWNWQTNYWVEIGFDGNGSVDLDSGFQAKDSEQILTATPDEGWLFTGWSGAAYGTGEAIVLMTEPQSITAHFSTDPDEDGLTNTEEAAAGSNPWKADTDDDGFDDAFEVAQGLSPTNDNSAIVNYIADNETAFGLYPSNVVLDVAVGQMLIETMGGNATLSLQLEESDDLITWTNAGPAEVWSWPVDGEKKYFRVRSAK